MKLFRMTIGLVIIPSLCVILLLCANTVQVQANGGGRVHRPTTDSKYAPELVKRIQEALINKELLECCVNGEFNHETKNAVKQFQLITGRKADGNLDKETIRNILETDLVLKTLDILKHKGIQVCCSQSNLAPPTKLEIERFQKSENLPITGHLDDKTLKHLLRKILEKL
ncbi:MAG: peptidoglycan-binding protein [Deltaproteobacteria bacterium]|nr:peptidoglycan-binding protein [Deltaproteobacteria bacterium]